MPPAFVTMELFPCSNWDDVPNYYFVNVILALFGAYTATVVSSTSVFAMIVLLVYPVEVQLLLLKEFKRYLTTKMPYYMFRVERCNSLIH